MQLSKIEQLDKKKIIYYNIHRPPAMRNFCKTFRKCYFSCKKQGITPVLLCIGSDRATGDCLGPLVGHKLHAANCPLAVYGTLRTPIHAGNLPETIHEIHETFPNAHIIALDASLGIDKHVGFVTMGKGNLYPGIGVNKVLPQVGDTFITGIVNSLGGNSHLTLQTTHLSMVMELADFIANGIIKATMPHYQ